MKAISKMITIRTRSRFEIIDITAEVEKIVREADVDNGFVLIHEPHTTAAVTINENDPSLFTDFINIYTKIAPPNGEYEHNRKYMGIPSEQNAHAHIISSLIKPSVVIPVINGRIMLGTWQRVLFIELDGPRTREVNIIVYY